MRTITSLTTALASLLLGGCGGDTTPRTPTTAAAPAPATTASALAKPAPAKPAPLGAPAVATAPPAAPLDPLPTEIPADAAPVTVTIDAAAVVNEVDGDFHGTNFCAYWNNTGDSPATLSAVAGLGAKTFRFPGGTVANWYDWEHPYPKEHHDVWRDSAAWRLAESVGGCLMPQTNIAQQSSWLDNTGAHQAGWLAFAKEHGYRVGWWEIGNEPEMDAPAPFKQGEDRVMGWYNAVYEDQAKAIRAVDPKARILGYSGTNVYFWWALRGLEMFLAAHGDKQGTGLADGISLHWYVESGDKPWDKVRGAAQGWQGCMDYIDAVIQRYDSRDLPVDITEWNFAGGMNGMSVQTYSTALGNADMIGMMLRTGVKGQQYFCLQGPAQAGWGALEMKGSPRGEAAPHPTYYALALASHLTGKVLATKPDVDEANVLSAYAAQDAAGTLHVMLINKGEKPAAVTLACPAIALAGREAIVGRLESPNDDPKSRDVVFNGVAGPHPEQGPLPPARHYRVGERCAIVLRPVSMALLSFPGTAPIAAKPQRRIIAPEKVKQLGIGAAKATVAKRRDPATPAVPLPHLATPPAFTADPEAWAAIPAMPMPFMKSDHGSVKLAWSADGLHGLAQVRDADITANAKEPWKADSIELFIEKDDAGNWDRGVASAQYAFSPDPKSADGVGLAMNAFTTAADKKNPATSHWRKLDDGWALEFFIPAAALVPARMEAGVRLGLNFAVNVDGRPVEQFFSDKNQDNGWNNPASWGVVVLSE